MRFLNLCKNEMRTSSVGTEEEFIFHMYILSTHHVNFLKSNNMIVIMFPKPRSPCPCISSTSSNVFLNTYYDEYISS